MSEISISMFYCETIRAERFQAEVGDVGFKWSKLIGSDLHRHSDRFRSCFIWMSHSQSAINGLI